MVRTLVERKPTSSIWPRRLSVFTKSPTTKGLSIKIKNDPNRFSKVSFDAKAIANPPIPKPAIILATLSLKTAPKIKRILMITVIALIEDAKKGTNKSSILDVVLFALSRITKPI